jgi:hypothetical protein
MALFANAVRCFRTLRLGFGFGGRWTSAGKSRELAWADFFFFFFVELGELRCPATGAKKSLQNRSLQPKGEIMFFFKTKL